MLDLEVLVIEFFAVDRLASCAIASSEVTTLKHEFGYDTMKLGALDTGLSVLVVKQLKGSIITDLCSSAVSLTCRRPSLQCITHENSRWFLGRLHGINVKLIFHSY